MKLIARPHIRMPSEASPGSATVPVASVPTFQHALFACQKWHLRRQLSAERTLRAFDRLEAKAFREGRPPSGEVAAMIRNTRRAARRAATLHRRFVDAITPFVRSPIGNGLLAIDPVVSDRLHPLYSPQPGEIPFKQYLAEQSALLGISPKGVYDRLWRANFRGLTLHRVNARVIFVSQGRGSASPVHPVHSVDKVHPVHSLIH